MFAVRTDIALLVLSMQVWEFSFSIRNNDMLQKKISYVH